MNLTITFSLAFPIHHIQRALPAKLKLGEAVTMLNPLPPSLNFKKVGKNTDQFTLYLRSIKGFVDHSLPLASRHTKAHHNTTTKFWKTWLNTFFPSFLIIFVTSCQPLGQ